MPQLCSVLGCKSVLRKNNGISFHCFPKEEKMRQRWLSSMSYGVLKWDRRPRVCSKHFKKEDFIFGGNLTKLSKYAIPSRIPRAIPNVQSMRDMLPPSSLGNIPTTSFSNVENTFTASANCISPSESTLIDVLVAATPNVPCHKEKAAINTKHEDKPSTSKVTMKRKLETLSEALNNSIESFIDNISRISEQANQNKDLHNTLITPKLKVTQTLAQTANFEISNPALEDVTSCTKEHCPNLRSITILENEIAYLKQENQRLQQLSVVPKPQFCLQQFSANDKKILYYTGFQTYEILSLVFKWVLPSGDVNNDIINNEKKAHRPSKLSAENQFFLTLIRLRRGMPIETLSDIFSISKSCADKIFLSWINLLYSRLGALDIWPNRNELIKKASNGMKENYPNIIGSINCLEFFIQRPSSQSQCSKGATTLKALIMINTAGAIIYTSSLFTGSISDKAIIADSGFINTLKKKVNEGQILPSDTILAADKGFNVQDLFNAVNLDNIKIPVFRVGGIQFTSEEVAHERIYVERAIGRLKNYEILSSKISVSSLGAIEQIYMVCVLLSNFRCSLIKKEDT